MGAAFTIAELSSVRRHVVVVWAWYTISNRSNCLTHIAGLQGTSLASGLTGDIEPRERAGEEVSTPV